MGDVVVITGASGGIGRATARRFAQDGAKIALLARGQAGLEGIATEVEELGAKALVLPTDVAEAEQVEAAAQAAESELGSIDIWVNDAMATIYAEFLDLEPDEYRRATDVTYHGMVWGTRAALRRMAERNRGSIVRSARRSPSVASRCRRPTAARRRRARTSRSPSSPRSSTTAGTST